jgi:hypothetical protein
VAIICRAHGLVAPRLRHGLADIDRMSDDRDGPQQKHDAQDTPKAPKAASIVWAASFRIGPRTQSLSP